MTENENKKAGYQERVKEIDKFLEKKDLLQQFMKNEAKEEQVLAQLMNF